MHRFNPQHSGLRIQHCCRCSSNLIPPHATGRPKKNPQKNLFCIFISPTSLWGRAQDSVLGSLPTLIPLMVTLDLFLKIYKLKTFKFMFLVPAFPADFKWVCSPASFTSHVQNQIPTLALHPRQASSISACGNFIVPVAQVKTLAANLIPLTCYM